MARLKLSKHELAKQRRQLALYRRTLPSLDLKRRQLTVALEQARRELASTREHARELERSIGEGMPMLADDEIQLDGLVTMTSCEIDEENLVGVRLPVLRGVRCNVADYSMLAKPAWVDFLVECLQEAAEDRARVQVALRRVSLLELHERRTTQRVNLFERILIPQAQRDIQRIQVYLGDQERAAVARSKLAKKKQQELRAAAQLGGTA